MKVLDIPYAEKSWNLKITVCMRSLQKIISIVGKIKKKKTVQGWKENAKTFVVHMTLKVKRHQVPLFPLVEHPL